jgi:hypothetical protein
VSLVRPKLEGFVPGAMIAHPKLHLRNWQGLISNGGNSLGSSDGVNY